MIKIPGTDIYESLEYIDIYIIASSEAKAR